MSTLYFPQLASGSISQFPSRKHISQRTVLNQTPGNGTVKMSDPEAGTRRWELGYTGLTDTEMGTLEALFAACEGRLRTFVFIDPCGNLLRWTEELSNSVWQTSLLTAGDIEDPNGSAGAWRLTNGAQAPQAISQTVDAPGWYRYAFSVWVRSGSASWLDLRLSNADGAIQVRRAVSETWQRISVAGEIEGGDDKIRCAIELPPASAVEIFGPQLDAQRDAAGYRKNLDKPGVWTARFDQDALECVSYGPDNHSAQIEVVTVREVTA